MKLTALKFPGFDDDIRGLIDDLTTVFIRNIDRLVWLKRTYQAFSSLITLVLFIVVAASGIILADRSIRFDTCNDQKYLATSVCRAYLPTWYAETTKGLDKLPALDSEAAARLRVAAQQFLRPDNRTLLLGLATLLVIFATIQFLNRSWLFVAYWNNRAHTDGYLNSLDKSCETVSQTIKDRMMSLGLLIAKFEGKLHELWLQGEKLPNQNMKNEELKGYNGFFYVQLILWLAKRNEYQELYLFDKVHEMQRNHFVRDMIGYAAALGLTVLSATSVIAVTYYPIIVLDGLFAEPERSWGTFRPAVAAFVLVLAMAALFEVLRFGYESYNNPRWNPAAELLEEKLETKSWKTFSELKIDEVLAGEYQKVLGALAVAREDLRRR